MGKASRIAGVSAPGAASAPAPAPNVAAATASVFFQPWANAQQFGFSGAITLPTVQTYLKRIDVMAFDPGGIGHLVASFTSWGASPVSYSGVVGLQPSSAQTWSVQFICYNAAGTPAPSPYTVSAISVAAPTVTSVTGREVPNSLTTDPSTRLVETTIGITPAFLTAQLPHIGTYLVSRDNGVTFVWVGWQTFTAAGQEVTCLQVKPQTTQYWKVAVIPYAYPWDASIVIPAANLPTGTVVSASFTVVALGLPGAMDVTTLIVPAGTGPGANPYNTQTADGLQFFAINGISYNDYGAVSDPEAFVVLITAQDLDTNHNAIGPEQQFGHTVVSQAGQTQTYNALMGEYGTSGYGYTRTANLAYVRLKVYVCNRVDQTNTSFSNSLCATLQTSIGSGAGHVDVLVASGGTPPTGALVGARVTGTVPSATSAATVPGSGVTGTVTLGGGGTATTVAQTKDASGNVVCWMGQYTVSSVTYYGIWASNVWIGGSGPAAAKIWLDTSGNAHFSGTVESGSTITAPTISGGSLAITTATAAVSINSSSQGVDIALSGNQYNGFNLHYGSDHIGMIAGGGVAQVTCASTYGYLGQYGAGYLTLTDSSGNSGAYLNGQTGSGYGLVLYGARPASIGGYIQAGGGVYVTGTYAGYGVYCPTYGVNCYSLSAGVGGIYTSGTYTGGAFQGAGVNCTSYGVACYSLTVGAGGLSVGGYSGSTNLITFKDSAGGYCTLNGSALRMEFNYGIFNGLI